MPDTPARPITTHAEALLAKLAERLRAAVKEGDRKSTGMVIGCEQWLCLVAAAGALDVVAREIDALLAAEREGR